MEFFADLHLHSKYSRACSKNLDLENLVYWGKFKGVNLFGTGDFTHPAWLAQLREKLEDNGQGFFRLKNSKEDIYFALTCEISSIFSRQGTVKRIHYVVMFPDFASVEKFNQRLSLVAKLSSDGRPITGLDVKNALKLALEVNPDVIFIPAHIWTPWFSLLGSMSGFNSIDEAFEELTEKIYAVETGLSSDPGMNWRLSQLDRFQIVSFSDAHSPQPHRIGRETTVFELEAPSYFKLQQALKSPTEKNKIKMTTEFYPEEGKYHFDGHRLCNVCSSPQESKQNKYLCPVCGRRVTIGVMSRVEELADRPANFQPANRPAYKNLVPLTEVIAKLLKTQPITQKVFKLYFQLIEAADNEFNLWLGEVDLSQAGLPANIIEGINKAKAGCLLIKPGFDGEYGVVELSSEDKAAPKSLF